MWKHLLLESMWWVWIVFSSCFTYILFSFKIMWTSLFFACFREAARECRRKKKEYVKCLENRVAVLENQNKTLIEELKALKELYCQKEGWRKLTATLAYFANHKEESISLVLCVHPVAAPLRLLGKCSGLIHRFCTSWWLTGTFGKDWMLYKCCVLIYFCSAERWQGAAESCAVQLVKDLDFWCLNFFRAWSSMVLSPLATLLSVIGFVHLFCCNIF